VTDGGARLIPFYLLQINQLFSDSFKKVENQCFGPNVFVTNDQNGLGFASDLQQSFYYQSTLKIKV
jgi:hypothetical protein